MCCCPGSPCGPAPRGPFWELVDQKFGPLDLFDETTECFDKVFTKLSCEHNREMKKARLSFQKEVSDALTDALIERFPGASASCLEEHVPKLVGVALSCLQECRPDSPLPFLTCITSKGAPHIVAIVRCLLADQKVQLALDVKLSVRDWVELAESAATSIQQGKVQCLIQLLATLLPALCGGIGGGGGVPSGDPKPSEKPRC